MDNIISWTTVWNLICFFATWTVDIHELGKRRMEWTFPIFRFTSLSLSCRGTEAFSIIIVLFLSFCFCFCFLFFNLFPLSYLFYLLPTSPLAFSFPFCIMYQQIRANCILWITPNSWSPLFALIYVISEENKWGKMCKWEKFLFLIYAFKRDSKHFNTSH